MSVLTAIFQAIAQAICWIFPISESAHSSIFHDFAGRSSGACSTLTGIVHIGIALGIVLSMYGFFFSLAKEFFGTFADLFKKQLRTKKTTPVRSYMYMTLISFAPMVLWLIPTGKGFLFSLLKSTGHNASIFEDGLFLAITGALVIVISKLLNKPRENKDLSWTMALAIGFANVLLVPVSGFSLIAGELAMLLLFGISKKLAYRYPLVISAPLLVVMGIIEICTSVTPASIVQIIFGLILSVGASFLCVRMLQWVIKNSYIIYFGIYDIAFGVIAFIIGIFELILK